MLDIDTFLLELYVLADAFCQQQDLRRPKRGRPPALTPTEVIVLALLARWNRFESERAFYRFAKQRLTGLFPVLPDRSQFNRAVRVHQRVLELFFRQ